MFHPILLLGGLLIGVPVLLHFLRQQEPKKMRFAAFRFLQQKRMTNQRKMRLRHFLLLALRILIIALMALALFQPSLYSDRFNIRGEQPIATVIIVDTTPSMGYTVGDKSRFDEAKVRILELLDELPEKSPVAILDTGDVVLDRDWLPSVAEARKVVQNMAGIKSVSRPVTAALDQAYRLMLKQSASGSVDEVFPRLLAVFSDRTIASWEAERVGDLEQQKTRIPPPEINTIYIDVGVEKPFNLALGLAQMPSQVVPADQPAIVNINAQALGQDVENIVVARFDGESSAERQPLKLAPGENRTFSFRRTDLKPGLHTVEISLFSTDSLVADNVRYLTFRVREPRQTLTLVDDPADATVWQLALKAFRTFSTDIKTTQDVLMWKPESWNQYELVTVLSVRQLGPIWGALEEYVQRGGKLLILPGGDELLRDDYNGPAAKKLLPAEFVKVLEADAKTTVTWLWNSLNFQHPLLAPFREWQQQNNLDFIRFPPTVSRYWATKAYAPENSIVSYNDADKNPALIERTIGRGRVMMFTTPMDARRDNDDRFWNDYLQTSFYLVISNNSLRYLAGDTEEQAFNHLCGLSLTLDLPLNVGSRNATFILEGPGISGSAAILKATSDNRLNIDREQTANAGQFTVRGDNRKLIDGFSLNIDPQESNLDRLPVETIEALLGEGSVIPIDKGFKLSDRLQSRFTQPVDLFPWLMLLVLFAFAGEGFLANRFYRQPAPKVPA